ncbi:MAG TPA: serine/threonine protein kinase [Stellaceae bacterium]|nr:serine/threonine protein kinase [Stellaceae bacterium]
MSDTILVHGTAIAIAGEGILLRGPSGAGKSDLALRLIDGGARLVADDQVLLSRRGERVLVRAPATIAGLVEIRGVGIVQVETIAEAPLALIADLVPADRVERLPQRRTEPLLGLDIPLIALDGFAASAAAKLRLLRRALAAGGLPTIIAC